MIHVDVGRLPFALPLGWRKRAADVQAELDSADPETAAEILKKKGIWRELNALLRDGSGHKCWYSEARDTASRMDVDHFRPKGNVLEQDGSKRPGYPFLAYDFGNYRLSAQLMNQRTREGGVGRGKHQQFPLESGSPCATDRAGIADERPLLLDPTNPADPQLLTFDEQGEAKPLISSADDPRAHMRATRTIEVLWLDRPALSDRRKEIWSRIHEDIKLVDRFSATARERTGEGRPVEAAEEWGCARTLLDRLRLAAQPTSEFSGAATAALRTSGRGWAERMAERAERLSLICP